MAATTKGVESRPGQAVTGSRYVGDVNTDEETRAPVGEVADGVDDATRDLIVHDTTTRERRTVSKRAHEPLDLDAAEPDQPKEGGNGPRAKEIAGGEAAKAADPTVTNSDTPLVSEKQIKAGAEAAPADTAPSGADK